MVYGAIRAAATDKQLAAKIDRLLTEGLPMYSGGEIQET